MGNTGHYDTSVTSVQIKTIYIQDVFSIIFILIMRLFYFNNIIYNSNIDHYINT